MSGVHVTSFDCAAAKFRDTMMLGLLLSLFSFLVMGDWGGEPSFPFWTLGEQLTAAGMEKVATDQNSSFVLALGDNFYDSGVQSVNDPRFNETFEQVFKGPYLQKTEFHVLAGNHDHRGNVSAQIAYSRVSKRWSFPSLYYTFTRGDVQFVFIDTVILAGNSDDVEMVPHPDAETQWQWIENTLASSKSHFLVVAGHYPVFSIAEHGPTAVLVERLLPMLEKYEVSAYFCGHEHNSEYLEYENVQFHVIGGAHSLDNTRKHEKDVPAGSLKFFWADGISSFASVYVDDDKLTITHLDSGGKPLYSAPAVTPRKTRPLF